MKSFAIAALAGAATAAWAPPAYGGQSSAEAVSSSAPAEEYTQPAGYEETSAPAPTGYGETSVPAYGGELSSASQPAGYTKSTPAEGYSKSSSMVTKSVPAYGTGSAPVQSPTPTGGYGGSWGSGNSTGGWGEDSYITEVVTSFETYCPGPTTLTYNSKTYTVTSATTLTVTDCDGGCEHAIPATSYKPETTTEVVTSFTTTCPYATTATYGPNTYTVSESTVLTVTDCPGGCTVSKEVPGTFVVPTYTTVCPKPSQPTTVTIGTQTYPVTEATTLTVTNEPTMETKTQVFTKPAQPTSYVVDSTTIPITEATTVTYSQMTQPPVTVTAPASEVYPNSPVASSPAAPVPAQPSGYAPSGYTPAGNGSSPVSPEMPVQTGNGAGKLMAGGAAFGAAVAAFFL